MFIIIVKFVSKLHLNFMTQTFDIVSIVILYAFLSQNILKAIKIYLWRKGFEILRIRFKSKYLKSKEVNLIETVD